MRAPKLFIAIAAFALLSCLDEHPLVRPGEFTDVHASLATDASRLGNFDSIRVEIRDGNDSGRILSAWTGSGDSTADIPIQFHSMGDDLLVKVRGYVDSIGYCYTAWYREDRLIASEDSCELLPKLPLRIAGMSLGYPEIELSEPPRVFAVIDSNLPKWKGLFKWDMDGNGTWDGFGQLPHPSSQILGPAGRYEKPGGYWIRFMIADMRGHSAIDSIRIAVIDSTENRIIDITALSPRDTTVSINDSIVFRATATSRRGNLKGFGWDFDGDGAQDSTGPLSGAAGAITATRRFGDKVGKIGVRLHVYDADSNSASKEAVVNVVQDAPSAKSGPDTSVELGDSITLDGIGSDGIGRIVSANWYGLGDTAVLDPGNRIVVKGAAIGVKSYIYKVIDDDGLIASDTITVTTIPPDPNVALRELLFYPGVLSPKFSQHIAIYQVEVPAGTDSLKLTARPASGKATVTLSGIPGASAKGDLFRTLPFSQGEIEIGISVSSAAGTEAYYLVKVKRLAGSGGTTMGYARVLDPMATGSVLGSALAYNSAGQPVQFSRSGAGRYRLTFPVLGLGSGEGNVQVTAYGAVAGYCAVESWGGPDFIVNLACARADGSEADIPFGVSATWPRPHSTGGNAFISNDSLPPRMMQKTKTASAYNSFNGAATGSITAAKFDTGHTETAFISMNSDMDHQGNALVTLHGLDSGWCKIAEVRSAGADVIAATDCFGKSGKPADRLFSISAISPIIGSRDFDIAYAVAPGPAGFDDSLPDPIEAFNSKGGAISSTRLGTGRYQVRFVGMETAGQERTGVVHVSAYGEAGSGFCQVKDWSPSGAIAEILCNNAAGIPEDSRFSIRVIR